jgi:hypothetical protein
MTIDSNDKILSIQHQVSVDGYALLMDFVVTFVSLAAFLRFRLQLILGGNHTDRSLIEETGAEPSSAAAEQSRNWSKKKKKLKLEPRSSFVTAREPNQLWEPKEASLFVVDCRDHERAAIWGRAAGQPVYSPNVKSRMPPL